MRGFEVLEALKAGKKVRRVTWDEEYYYHYNNEKNRIVCDKGLEAQQTTNTFFESEWEIYKEYVSFTEAMKAFEEGGTVRAWGDGGYIELDEFKSFRKLAADYPSVYGLRELSRMKWTIES